jgi:hypothetical protein
LPVKKAKKNKREKNAYICILPIKKAKNNKRKKNAYICIYVERASQK